MSQAQACGSCRFYKWRACRASAPVRSSDPRDLGRGLWPAVEEDDWCGRWHPSDAENQRVRLAIEAAQEQLGE